ncbi:MAG: SEL1-like repeat protein [Spirochaetaceae bacterium]|nr:SEL1-like repeat protein [Spirochaetaceae bacterium]
MAAVTGIAHETDSVEELTRAAERGDAEAQFQLGFMYASGFGDFDEDEAEALRWYRRSAEQGLARAQSYVGT